MKVKKRRKMTEALFLETAQYEEQLQETGERRLNVSGVLRILGVSRSGYISWKDHLPSDRELRKEKIKERIQEIYDESHQNYGAPKNCRGFKKSGGNYIRKDGW